MYSCFYSGFSRIFKHGSFLGGEEGGLVLKGVELSVRYVSTGYREGERESTGYRGGKRVTLSMQKGT